MLATLRKLLVLYFVATGVAAHLAVLAVLVALVTLGVGDVRQMLVGRIADLRSFAQDLKVDAERVGAGPDFTALAEPRSRFAFHDYGGQVDPQQGYGVVRPVGPGKPYASIDLALRAANPGDIIEVEPGTYPGHTAVVIKNDIVIRGRGGVVVLDALRGALAERKAIIVARANNVLIENIEFANAESPDRNGSGIRAEGTRLHVRNCYFHDNQEGILSSAHLKAELVVEDSEFARNGWVDGQAHQVYVGRFDRFEFRRNYVYGTVAGSAVKSRASLNIIEYNFIADGPRGSGNYSLDLTDGGQAVIVGNVIEKAKDANNSTFVSYGAEAMSWQDNSLYLAHNTLVNDRFDGIFINNHSKVLLHAWNNLFIGRGESATGGPVEFIGNLLMGNSRFGTSDDDDLDGDADSGHNRVVEAITVRDRGKLDYRPTAASPAVDTAVAMPATPGMDLTPTWEHPGASGPAPRVMAGAALEVGALELPAAP